MDKFAKINFLGASGVVTGSKFLIETSEKNILIDCGMFQGLKELRELNWSDLPIDVEAIDVVLLTHGHLDHVGYLPRLIKQGFIGEIIGTAPTLAIAEIILKDSAKIHEEEANKANKRGSLPAALLKVSSTSVNFASSCSSKKLLNNFL